MFFMLFFNLILLHSSSLVDIVVFFYLGSCFQWKASPKSQDIGQHGGEL